MATLYLAKQSMFGTSLHKSVFQNDLPDLDSLVIYQSHIAHSGIRLRTVTFESELWKSIKPAGASTVSGDSAGELENLTRTHDILFCAHLCVSLHCICIGAPKTPSFSYAIPERFAGGLL